MTSTIDPTLAAQFVVTPQATRLPTFTAPPPLVLSTYVNENYSDFMNNIPIGMVIVSLAAIGFLLMLFAISQGR
jgi:hypothetical protein